jgi:hypothetical protein
MFNLISTSGKTAYGVKEFALDLESDLASIDVSVCNPGSVAFIIENSKYYMLNSAKQWVTVQLASGGGGGNSGGEDGPEEVIYNGGLI